MDKKTHSILAVDKKTHRKIKLISAELGIPIKKIIDLMADSYKLLLDNNKVQPYPLFEANKIISHNTDEIKKNS